MPFSDCTEAQNNHRQITEFSSNRDFNAPFCVCSTAIKVNEEGDGDKEISMLTETFKDKDRKTVVCIKKKKNLSTHKLHFKNPPQQS